MVAVAVRDVTRPVATREYKGDGPLCQSIGDVVVYARTGQGDINDGKVGLECIYGVECLLPVIGQERSLTTEFSNLFLDLHRDPRFILDNQDPIGCQKRRALRHAWAFDVQESVHGKTLTPRRAGAINIR